MAYTYHDWPTQATVALQLERLNLHIAEVSALLQPDLSSDGQSQSNGSLQAYLQTLFLERDKLQSSSANVAGGGFFKIRRNRG